MAEMKLGLHGIEGLKIEFTREKRNGVDEYYYKLTAQLAVEGKPVADFHQYFTRQSLEDDFESKFNIMFELTRRRLLTMIAEERGEKISEPFYGVTFGAGERRDLKGVLLPEKE